MNMPPRWGFSSFASVAIKMSLPELKNGSSPTTPIAALIQQQCTSALSPGASEERGKLSLAARHSRGSFQRGQIRFPRLGGEG